MLIGLILFSVLLAAVAQLTLKHGMNQVADSSGALQLSASSVRDVVTTPAVWGGLFLFGLSAIVWLAASRTGASSPDRPRTRSSTASACTSSLRAST